MSLTVAVAGGGNQVGRFLIPALLESGHRVLVLSRRGPPPWIAPDPRLRWHAGDAEATCGDVAALVLLAPLALLPTLRRRLGAIGRYIVFSSTSAVTKSASSSAAERALAAALVAGESRARALAAAEGAPCVVLRPTLIYGAGLDRNLTRVAGAVRRFGLFPLVGPGRGLRQPVHAQDLARLALRLATRETPASGTFALPGGARIPYRQMIAEVFVSVGRTPRFVPVPRLAVRGVVPLLRLLPAWRDLRGSMFDRMNEDLVFDAEPARRELGFEARPFEPAPETWRPPPGPEPAP